MLPKVYRLSREKSIQQAFKTRFRTQTEGFKIFLNTGLQTEFQLLIVIPKKVFKRANKRNRLRRKISSIFEELLLKRQLPLHTTCIIQATKQNSLYKNVKSIQKEIVPQVSELFLQKTSKQTQKRNANTPS